MQIAMPRDGEVRERPQAPSTAIQLEAPFRPATIGSRIKERREALRLKQEQVSKLCYITQKSNSQVTGRMKGDTYPLSRTAYSMYETDSVTPVLDVLEQIAYALRTSPSYIAFGQGSRDPVLMLGWRRKIDEFVAVDTWDIPNAWLRETFDLEPSDVALVQVQEFIPHLNPGDVALVQRDVEPTRAGANFAYGLCGSEGILIHQITRPARAGPYRVYTSDLKRHRDVEPGDLKIIGKVIGKVSAGV